MPPVGPLHLKEATKLSPTMVASAERVRVWFELARTCLVDEHWKLAASVADGSLSHRSCPLGGQVIRFDFRNVFVKDAPENPSDLLVRPEVRGQYGHLASMEGRVTWRETLAPGDALAESSSYKLWAMASVLFGNLGGASGNTFFYHTGPALTRGRLRRDFPQMGDCSYACFQECEGTGKDFMMISRNEGKPELFRILLLFSMPDGKWAHWASKLFPGVTQLLQKGVSWFMNRPGIKDMRAVDQKMYVILSLKNFHRGPPMFPHLDDESAEDTDVRISSGAALGLASWSRWQPKERFRLAQYLRGFFEKLGHHFHTHETLDGRTLVPYQCAMLRQEWQEVRSLGLFRLVFYFLMPF